MEYVSPPHFAESETLPDVWSQIGSLGLPMKILIWPEHLELEGAPPTAVDPNSSVACCCQEGDLQHYHV